ncbi:MAG: YqaJ viral recombinase family protein, partial [Kiritimatiellae bacterium]|nr:YqaJ viral recombinase family protein [Kiritimatiellia bacterium]
MKAISFQTDSGSPNTAAWHAWRAQGIGGSEAASIAFDAGLIPEKASWMPNLEQLYGRKIGVVPPQELNGAMQRGTDGEGPAREKYEEITGNLVSPCFGEMDGREYVRASLDGLDFGGDLLVELKCAGQKVHEFALMGGIVPYYQPQVVHQACV